MNARGWWALSAACLAVLGAGPPEAIAASSPRSIVTAVWVAAPEDVGSPAAVTAALYDVISGPAGEARDWDRLRSLFRPEARFVPVVAAKDGGFDTRVWTVEDYITNAGPRLERDGFFEMETSRREERFQNIVHVFSGYEARLLEGGPVVARGVNSIQMMHDGRRWWVLNLAWDQARPGTGG